MLSGDLFLLIIDNYRIYILNLDPSFCEEKKMRGVIYKSLVWLKFVDLLNTCKKYIVHTLQMAILRQTENFKINAMVIQCPYFSRKLSFLVH